LPQVWQLRLILGLTAPHLTPPLWRWQVQVRGLDATYVGLGGLLGSTDVAPW
jgi:hypothetical protein